MTRNNKATVYTQLDEQRYKLWIQRLENSIKNYLEVSESNDQTIIQKEILLQSIEDTVRKEFETYPNWISLQSNIHPAKLASSSNEMKTFLRHICFPHVMESYHKLIEEITSSFNYNNESNNSSNNSSSVLAITNNVDSDSVNNDVKIVSNKHILPIQTAPIYVNLNARDTTVYDFFTSISSGKDGIVNLCKLADINHRILRANVHDNQQITQWIANEQTRKESTTQSIELRNQKLQYLRGNDENKFIEQSVGFLKSEIEVLYNQFTQAEDEEEKARKMYEAAVLKRRQAGQNLSNLENFIVNVSDQQELLQKVNEFRLEADLYNMNSAESRVQLFSGIEKYVKSVQSNFIQNRLSSEIPQLFDNLVNSFKQAQITSHNSNIDDTSKDTLSLSCAARVGLETIRIWKQLELTNGNPLLDKSIEDFENNLLSMLQTCALPQPVDANTQDIYRVSDSTVVLFFDHLCHDTPEDHVEAQSRVSTCLKMLMDRLVDDESNGMDTEVPKQIRSMVVLNCNDVISPPVWCLPLAHSPQYLSQLWNLAAAARKDDLYVPLEFDTEWISEDPYHTSSDEEGFHGGKSSATRTSASTAIGLMRSVDVEPSWSTAFTEKDRFHDLLTPVDTDHIVAKVIAKMEQKAAAKNTRTQKIAATKTKTDKESNHAIMRKDTTANNDASQFDNSTDRNEEIPLAILGDETIVRTPFGNGKVIESYRTDKLVSVQLAWGAVGHFNKDSIYYMGLTLAANILKKTEKPYYSAAQAFYVTGSGGRFAHTDMQMHNLLARIVTIVRVQRVIGDLVGVAHANLSLYMHGRTSSGLTRSIENNVNKWIESIDLSRTLTSIEKAENTISEGKEVNIDHFLRELEFTGKLPSYVTPVVAATAAAAQPTQVKIESKKRSQNIDNLILSTVSNIKEEVINKVSNIQSKKDYNEAAITPELPIEKQMDKIIPSPKPSPSYKSNENRTFSSKYSVDGEVLRDVMLVIIQRLKMSQGSLSNEYYRCFRYETSAAGVIAWFNFRGNNATFEHLNHCALMWVEDRKSYLSAEDQIRFDEINKRMSQISSSTSNELNEIQQANDDDDDEEEDEEEEEEEEQNDQDMLNLSNKNDFMHNDISMEIDEVRNNTDETDEVIDRNYYNNIDENQFNNIATSNEDYLNDEINPIVPPSNARMSSSDEDINSIEESYAMSEEVVIEDQDITEFNEGISSTIDYSEPINYHITTTTVVEDIIKPNDNEDYEEGEVENSNQDDNGDDDHQINNDINNNNNNDDDNDDVDDENDSSNESNLESEKETIESDNKDDDISVDQQDESPREPNQVHTNKTSRKMSSDVITDSKVVLNKIRTINDLHAALSFEMNRRKVSQSKVATEAKQRGLSVGQPALSKFLSVASIKNNERGKQFSEFMLKWIKWSMSEPSAEDWEPNQKPIAIQNRKRIEIKPVIIRTHESQHRFKTESDDRDAKANIASKSEKYMHCKVPNPKGGMNCGLCGMHSDDFSNMKCFHMHLAWCYHRRDSGKVVTTNQNEASNKRKLNISEDESNKKLRSNSVDSNAKFSIKLNIDDPFKDKLVLVPDTFKSGMHYETCDVCKEQGDFKSCDTCPCVYHSGCIDIDTSSFTMMNGKWYCMKCQESGASTASILSSQKKLAKDIVNTWILTYSSSLRCWRKSVVLTVHPEKKNVLLVKWWKVDIDGFKTNWLDVSKSTVLVATAERVGAASNRAQIQQIAILKERRANVRFTESFDNNDRRNLKSRFKENDRPLLMDGEHDMSVPPYVRAAASGVGGISALRDDEYMDEKSGNINISGNGMSDTYISSNSLKAALCASGSACKAVDIAICSQNTNVFACIRPPGHHAGRYGCTSGCLSTGFCLLNNAAIAAIYGRVRWGLERVAVVDIDVHFGNGTAELLRNDPNAFFASVHMIYGEDNDGLPKNIKVKPEQNDNTLEGNTIPIKKTRPSQSLGFYPARLGTTEVTDNYVSVGVYPPESNNKKGNTIKKKKKVVVYDTDSSESIASGQNSDDEVECKNEDTIKNEDQTKIVHITKDSVDIKPMEIIDSNEYIDNNILKDNSFIGAEGFIKALREVVIPQMEKFRPQLLVISAGFDGYVSDPLGGQLCLSLEDYKLSTKLLMDCMERIKATEKNPLLITGKVISLLEGGYDTSPFTLGLAKCVDAHVQALQEG